MLRVVLDANVFVSAVLKPQSNLAKILEWVKEGKIKLVISGDILSEIRSVLLYPKIKKRHCRTPKEVEKFLKKTVRISFITSGRVRVEEIKDDPEDNKYLSAALEGKADFIMSGDHHLKDIRIYQGIRILDPAPFLKLMAKPIER